MEWDLGARLCLSGRACVDAVISYLRCARYSPFQKRCVRALFCNAVYTRTRAADMDCVLQVTCCPLWGLASNTLRHRPWECQRAEVVELRDTLVSQQIQQWAAEADDSLAVFGVFDHLSSSYPKPLAKGGVVVEWVVGIPGDLDSVVVGNLFVVVSCTMCSINELNRAAWAFTLVDRDTVREVVRCEVLSGAPAPRLRKLRSFMRSRFPCSGRQVLESFFRLYGLCGFCSLALTRADYCASYACWHCAVCSRALAQSLGHESASALVGGRCRR